MCFLLCMPCLTESSHLISMWQRQMLQYREVQIFSQCHTAGEVREAGWPATAPTASLLCASTWSWPCAGQERADVTCEKLLGSLEKETIIRKHWTSWPYFKGKNRWAEPSFKALITGLLLNTMAIIATIVFWADTWPVLFLSTSRLVIRFKSLTGFQPSPQGGFEISLLLLAKISFEKALWNCK